MQEYKRIPFGIIGFQWNGTKKQLKENGVPFKVDVNGEFYLKKSNYDGFPLHDDVFHKTDYIVKEDRFNQWAVVDKYDFELNYEPLEKYHNLHSAGNHLDAFLDDCEDHFDEYDLEHLEACLKEIKQFVNSVEIDILNKK